MSRVTAAITAVNGYVPDYVMSNDELATMVDTNDEWITSRTGIKERRILKGEGKGLSDMAIPAVQGLLEKRGISAEEIDMLIVCTITPDLIFPATANIVCDKIGAKNAFGYDMMAACSGWMYGLVTGSKFIESGTHKKVVVVGGDKMSSIIDYTDRTTCIIFGDGCGAVLLEPNEEGYGVLDAVLHSDGSGAEFLYQPAGGSKFPPTHDSIDSRLHFVRQEGKQVFKFAVTNMADVSVEIMKRNNLTADDVAYLVPHQANLRIINATADRMGISEDKVTINIQKYGNTTSGTLPLCLWEWENKFNKGDNIIISAFGGGFTWGSVYVKWAYDS